MPQLILDKSEKWLFMLTLNARSDKYDLNHATVFRQKPEFTLGISKTCVIYTPWKFQGL